ncbi:hydroxyisourate hydrolase [Streptomyces sp. NBC_01198]|uniref:hydroxyisourate hydrolase n=1 Tax=Streptomyces sp. NBC_01198 TaxID=2903769 RepID=UPI002E0EDEB3|nr:hydroxyisourate hydrolase [Streptomyces sp. NBC_01198]
MTSVSTHILDTSAGRPAPGVAVTLEVRTGAEGPWTPHGGSATDQDGRCKDLPALPDPTTHARLHFDVAPYLARHARPAERGPRDAFFPEVAVVFTVTPGEHFHVPLLLNPFGYSVYRGS